jgi:branched-chain amino acid transport system permease protein
VHLVYSDLFIISLIYFVVAAALNLVIGYAKALSVHHAALFAIGAFTYSTFSSRGWSSDLLLTGAVAAVIAGVVSLLLAVGSLRVSGDYFVIASFAFQLVAIGVLLNWESISGGPFGVFGLDVPSILGLSVSDPTDFLVVAGVLAAGTLGLMLWLGRGPFGRLARAMGQSESAVGAAGFSSLRIRTSVFVLSGALAAVAGALYASYVGIAYAPDFGVNLSILIAAMVVIGGAGSMVGSVLGGLLLAFSPALLSTLALNQNQAAAVRQLLFAVLLIVVTITLPGGLAEIPRRVFALVRRGRRRPGDVDPSDVPEGNPLGAPTMRMEGAAR